MLFAAIAVLALLLALEKVKFGIEISIKLARSSYILIDILYRYKKCTHLSSKTQLQVGVINDLLMIY